MDGNRIGCRISRNWIRVEEGYTFIIIELERTKARRGDQRHLEGFNESRMVSA